MLKFSMPYKVLVIDDDISMADLEKRFLEKDGFVVSLAHSGSQALEVLAAGDTPDLLIIDYKLPDMSGVQLMQKAQEEGFSIPSVIVTAAGNEKVAVSAMKLGALDYLVKDIETIKTLPGICTEVLRRHNLEKENDRLLEQTQRLNAELMETNKRLEDLSRRDDLTGVYNRRYLYERLSYEAARFRRYGNPMCFALFDIDRFKGVNDTHGHMLGDLVLKQFANLLHNRLRRTDVLGRYGGEEFGVILTGTILEQAVELCEELRGLVANETFGNSKSRLHLTTSAGIASIHGQIEIEEIINVADSSLYTAKEQGRNRVVAVQSEASAAG